jgi:hypothetical protein
MRQAAGSLTFQRMTGAHESRTPPTPLLVSREALRLGLGAAEHVAGLGGARGVSGPAHRPLCACPG